MIYSVGEIVYDTYESFNLGKQSLDVYLGGAPLNVAVMASILGSKVAFISKIGDDILKKSFDETLKDINLDLTNLIIDKNNSNMIAIVSIDETGDRKFDFINKNSVDKNLKFEELNLNINDGDILNFSSVVLSSKIMVDTHLKLISAFKEKDTLINFDPNLRFNLFDDANQLREIVIKFLKLVDCAKISLEELLFLSESDNEDEALEFLKNNFRNLEFVTITCGSKPSYSIYKNKIIKQNEIFDGIVKDTTGAGDCYNATTLHQLDRLMIKRSNINELLNEDVILEIVEKSSMVASISTTYKGAISSYKKVKDNIFEKSIRI